MDIMKWARTSHFGRLLAFRMTNKDLEVGPPHEKFVKTGRKVLCIPFAEHATGVGPRNQRTQDEMRSLSVTGARAVTVNGNICFLHAFFSKSPRP